MLPQLCAKSRSRNAPKGSVSIKDAKASGSVILGTSRYSEKKPRPDDAIKKVARTPQNNPIIMLTKLRKKLIFQITYYDGKHRPL